MHRVLLTKSKLAQLAKEKAEFLEYFEEGKLDRIAQKELNAEIER